MHVVCRKVTVVQKPPIQALFIGIAAAGIEPDEYGTTSGDSSSYGMWSIGEVIVAGEGIFDGYHMLPASSIIQADLIKQREACDTVFSAGDEVVVVLDCTAHTLRLQSPTVQHVIHIQQQHHQQQWVLIVNFSGYDNQVIIG